MAGAFRRTVVRGALIGSIAVVVLACGGATPAATMESGGAAAPVGGGTTGPGRQPNPGGQPAAATAAPGQPAASPGAAGVPEAGPLVVKTGTLQLEVSELDATAVKARTVVVGAGGHVAGSDESRTGQQQVASITYRIPAQRWDEVVTGLRGLATKVVSEKTNAAEVTTQVVDLGARIQNLRASESAVQGIMGRAQQITEVLEVQRQLSTIRDEIERLTAQKSKLEDQAALGTLTVTWLVPVPVVPAADPKPAWDPGREFERATGQAAVMGQALVSFLIWFVIVGVPILLLTGALVAAVVLTVRWIDRRRIRQDIAAPPAPGA